MDAGRNPFPALCRLDALDGTPALRISLRLCPRAVLRTRRKERSIRGIKRELFASALSAGATFRIPAACCRLELFVELLDARVSAANGRGRENESDSEASCRASWVSEICITAFHDPRTAESNRKIVIVLRNRASVRRRGKRTRKHRNCKSNKRRYKV